MVVPDSKFLKVEQVLKIIKEAIKQKKPLSLVRVGDGENLILAQGSLWPIKKVLQNGWAIAANEGKKGVTLPNFKLRDQMVQALKKADIIGIPFWKNDPILASQSQKRPLTEAVFKHFNIQPAQICHTFVNRVFAQRRAFWGLLKGKRILIISRWADKAKVILEGEPYKLNIVSTISFTDYKQMAETIKKVLQEKDKFDIALISCGVNAVVLAQQIAELTGKIAIDFGKSLMFMVQKKAGLKYCSSRAYRNMLP